MADPVPADQALVNIQAEGLDPNYTGMPPTRSPWIVYALIAIAIYFLWGED
jgi:hypothetical protein